MSSPAQCQAQGVQPAEQAGTFNMTVPTDPIPPNRVPLMFCSAIPYITRTYFPSIGKALLSWPPRVVLPIDDGHPSTGQKELPTIMVGSPAGHLLIGSGGTPAPEKGEQGCIGMIALAAVVLVTSYSLIALYGS